MANGKQNQEAGYNRGQNVGSKNSDKVEYKKPRSGSGKEKANDVPGWASGSKPHKGENGRNFAKRLMEDKYGKEAKYDTGPASEFNKIKKWGDRGFE